MVVFVVVVVFCVKNLPTASVVITGFVTRGTHDRCLAALLLFFFFFVLINQLPAAAVVVHPLTAHVLITSLLVLPILLVLVMVVAAWYCWCCCWVLLLLAVLLYVKNPGGVTMADLPWLPLYVMGHADSCACRSKGGGRRIICRVF